MICETPLIRLQTKSENAMNYGYILKELRHHHHRTLVNILGIGTGIALFISINAISTAYKEAVSQPFKNIGADIVVQRPEKRAADSTQRPASMAGIRLPFSNQIFPSGDIEKLKVMDCVDSMATSLLLWEFDKGGFRTIMGVDVTRPGIGPVKVKEWIKDGRFPQKEGEAVLEKHYAKFHQSRLGDAIELGGRKFQVVGLLEIKEGAQIASANIYLSLTDTNALLAGNPKGANIVYLRLKDPSLLSQVKTQISGELNGVSVTSSDSFLELMGGVSRISDQFSFLVSVVAFLGAVLLIIKTMLSNLIERSREIGILKAVGWTEMDIHKQLMGEVFFQSLTGCVFGILIGYFFSYLLGFLSIPVSTPWELNLLPAFARDAQATVQSVRLPVSMSTGLIAMSFALTLVTGGLASYLMGRRTARMKPADILRQL
jgi:putative ABC transport system permease protein